GLLCAGVWYFFFSSRRRHTSFSRDWSSDVCSSDLAAAPEPIPRPEPLLRRGAYFSPCADLPAPQRGRRIDAYSGTCLSVSRAVRSEERRVGKEGRSRRAQYQ